MMNRSDTGETDDGVKRRIDEAARRALAEAEARRRAAADAPARQQVREIGGREGPDPVRYGDWDVKGITSDF
jgi:hypothetical protein